MPQLIKRLLDKENRKKVRWVFYAYTLFLFTVTLIPIGLIESKGEKWWQIIKFDNQDKIVHFLLFFFFTGLLFLAYRLGNFSLLIIPILTGILIEILQYIMPEGRSFDLFDILANSCGTLVMVILIGYLKKMDQSSINFQS